MCAGTRRYDAVVLEWRFTSTLAALQEDAGPYLIVTRRLSAIYSGAPTRFYPGKFIVGSLDGVCLCFTVSVNACR